MQYKIDADEVQIGKNVVIENNVQIRGMTGRARRIRIGDNSFIGHDTKIIVDDFSMGDYSMIHNHSLVSGHKECVIGHCSWFGQNCILNSTGGLFIGNGVGVGAYSQLWSHIRFGDTLQGCRWNSASPLIVEDDVWFVGHCIVSPITACEKSMALVGSVITSDMKPNHVYAGVPAKDITEKVGPQFEDVSTDEKALRLRQRLDAFYASNPDIPKTIRIESSMASAPTTNSTDSIFYVLERKYTKRLTPEEIAFMNSLLVEVKFFPLER